MQKERRKQMYKYNKKLAICIIIVLIYIWLFPIFNINNNVQAASNFSGNNVAGASDDYDKKPRRF